MSVLGNGHCSAEELGASVGITNGGIDAAPEGSERGLLREAGGIEV